MGLCERGRKGGGAGGDGVGGVWDLGGGGGGGGAARGEFVGGGACAQSRLWCRTLGFIAPMRKPEFLRRMVR